MIEKDDEINDAETRDSNLKELIDYLREKDHKIEQLIEEKAMLQALCRSTNQS
ncbi:MAG: hypothetical protein NC043_02995 [Muribaculaceae bacterium]|nr:hypothetical protein [Muribaculaceae bacterium]